jgi:hypothetical protein
MAALYHKNKKNGSEQEPAVPAIFKKARLTNNYFSSIIDIEKVFVWNRR